MKRRLLRIAISAVVLLLVGAGGSLVYVWLTTSATEIETPPEENAPEKLIERLAVAYDEREWEVYDTVYTGLVQRFLQATCGDYQECFSPHRDSVGSPISYEILKRVADEDEIIVDVRYSHPQGEWCQTYTVVDTEFGYRVSFSTTPSDCEE